MSQPTASKSQIRAARVLGLNLSQYAEYPEAARALVNANAPADGIPFGVDGWRGAAKLSDEQLLAGLREYVKVLALPTSPDRY